MVEPLPVQYWNRTPQQQNAATIGQQNEVFRQARDRGQISEAEYQEAMRGQAQAQAAANANNQVIPKNQATSDYLNSTAYYDKLGYREYGGLYSVPTVPEGYQVTKIEKDTTNNSLKFTIAPYESAALKQAKEQTAIREQMQYRSGAQQGTRSGVTGVLPMAPVTQGLNATDLAAYNQWKSDRDRGRIVDLGTFLVAGAIAPVLGPVGVIKAVTIGVGVAQGMKTGMTAIQGGDISQSLLTPHEAMQAAEFGVIFGGADKLSNLALARYGGSAGGKIAGTIPTVSVTERVGVGAARMGIETAQGTAIMSGIQYAERGKISAEDVAMNAAYSAGFAVAGRGAGYVRGKLPIPSVTSESIMARINPTRARESALYDRVVLRGDTATSVGSQGWINELKVKTSTNPTERSLYDRVVTQANNKPENPSLIGTKSTEAASNSMFGNFKAKATGKGDLADLYNRVVVGNKGNAGNLGIGGYGGKGGKGTKNGKGGSVIKASDIEITTKGGGPSNWVSQTLIVKPKTATRARQRMKPFGELGGAKMFEVSSLPIRDFTKSGVTKLKPKIETVEKPAVVVDQVGVKAITESRMKAKAKEASPTIEWQGIAGKVDNPFTSYKGRSFYGKKARSEYEDSYPATMPPAFGQAGSTSHLTITRLNINPLSGLGIGEIQRTKQRDIQRFDLSNAQRFDFLQGQAQSPITIQGNDQVPEFIQDYTQVTDQFTQTKTKQRSKYGLDLSGFELFGMGRNVVGGRRGHKRGESLYPILTGAQVLKSFLNKKPQSSKRSTTRRGKK